MILKNKNNKIIKEKQKGFTLLFAVLVSTLVLSVGASIITIALRQLILSGTGRESQFAFYAANTGIECALYWDLHPGVTFATAVPLDGGGTPFSVNPIYVDSMDCLEMSPSVSALILNPELADARDRDFYGDNVNIADMVGTTRFRLIFDEIGPDNRGVEYCTDVTVTKRVEGPSGSRRVATQILSRGYNTCDPNNSRRIERGLELNY